jgi:hypothetical protein
MRVHHLATIRRVYVRVTPSGAWVIHDEFEHRGGRFRDAETATRFIHREFGANTRIVFQPPLQVPQAA